MRNSAVLVLLLAVAYAAGPSYRMALPGYRFEFPRDYFNHPDFRTEWWYYTGNVSSPDGRRFGFELTFFRHEPEDKPRAREGVWDLRDVWMAHLALTDINGKQFLNYERMTRSGKGLAGVDSTRVWNGNWSVGWRLDNKAPAFFSEQTLHAVSERFALNLSFRSEKPPVLHGQNGISQKSAGEGHASYYFSLTRLLTSGSIDLDGRQFAIQGLSWMDHEFFSHTLEPNQRGWDWFSLQFTDGSELMLYRLRRKDGSIEPFSSGTWIQSDGTSRYLALSDIRVRPGRKWDRYPVEWMISVSSLSLVCNVKALLDAQELKSRTETLTTYWEGAVQVNGSRRDTAITGSGYLEMTGYRP